MHVIFDCNSKLGRHWHGPLLDRENDITSKSKLNYNSIVRWWFFSKIPWGSWYVHLYSWKITLVYVTTTILPYTCSLFHPHFCRCQTPYTIHLGHIFVVMPTWGNDSCWTNIFQLVWNHKLANYWTKSFGAGLSTVSLWSSWPQTGTTI